MKVRLLGLFFINLFIISKAYCSTETLALDPILDKKINLAIDHHDYKSAKQLIADAIKKDPNNPALYYRQALLEVDLEDYTKAKTSLNEIPSDTKNDAVKKLNDFVTKKIDLLPKNEIGYEQDEAYVSDLNSFWSYVFLHYYRFTSSGKYGFHVNFAKRYGLVGTQYVLEAYPHIFNGGYVAMNVGYANDSQKVWPTRMYYMEPYFELPHNFELSLGGRALKALSKNIYMKTISLGRYVGDSFLWGRVSDFTMPSSFYGELGWRRYLDAKNNYLGVKIGFGEIPDIADFAPLNQIIILHAKAINLEYQTPLSFNKNLIFKIVGGYTYQDFPSGLVRRITDVYFNLSWQF